MKPLSTFPVDSLGKEAMALYDSLTPEKSDMTVALFLTAFLEKCLGTILTASFREKKLAGKVLDPLGGGILGTFMSRVDACYLLGFINADYYSNLRQIAKIRNEFAHSHIEVGFGEPRIKSLCEDLSLPRLVRKVTEPDGVREEEIGTRAPNPRDRFLIVSVFLVEQLRMTAKQVEPFPDKGRRWRVIATG
jgi:DNA-binding MltR family transcriptional regulator